MSPALISQGKGLKFLMKHHFTPISSRHRLLHAGIQLRGSGRRTDVSGLRLHLTFTRARLQTKRQRKFKCSFEVLNGIVDSRAQFSKRKSFTRRDERQSLPLCCYFTSPQNEAIQSCCTVINRSCDIVYLPVYLQPSTVNPVI